MGFQGHGEDCVGLVKGVCFCQSNVVSEVVFIVEAVSEKTFCEFYCLIDAWHGVKEIIL